jgi:RsiW-degrading membrane proteinase PrsW (M82 family)
MLKLEFPGNVYGDFLTHLGSIWWRVGMSANLEARDSGRRKIAWLRVFISGLILYFVGIASLIMVGNPTLFPTVVMIGNFLMPVTFIAFLYERRQWSRLSLPTTALSFLYGGVGGVIAASILEPIFIRQLDFTNMFVVAWIEETVKIIGVVLIARRFRHNSELDGLILGAAAGMGFAALESTGYAFTAFLQSGGSLSATVTVTLIRGVLSPVGHGAWTGILASVLFRESGRRYFHFNLKVLGAYLLVIALHGLWDVVPPLIAVERFPGLDVFVGQSVIGALGLFILWRRWREARRLQNEYRQAVLDSGLRQAISPDGHDREQERVGEKSL